MIKYPLKRMLIVRELREDQAARALRRALARLDAALADLEARATEAEECRQCLRRREAGVLTATVGRRLGVGATHALQREVASWRARVEEAEEARDAAALEVEKADAECDAARAAYQSRMKDKHKIESHRGIWQARADKEAEAAEELELEESARPRAAGGPAAGAEAGNA